MKLTFERIKMALVWVSRIHRCRGFGIQSPWAFRFVRYVINGHYPYHGYDDVRKESPWADPLTVKLGKLYLRLANNLQPKTVVSFGEADEALYSYIKAGCSRANIACIESACQEEDFRTMLAGLDKIDMLRLTPVGNYRSFFNEAITQAREGSVFIIEDIKKNAEVKQFWREVVRLQDGVVTFDLYYCGLICFKPKLYKCNYVVNF